MVLTAFIVVALFGDEDPVGQTVIFNNSTYTVTAVVADVPLTPPSASP